MRALGLAAWLLLASGCASTPVVHLDTGRGDPIAFTPEESEPVEIGEDAFKSAVARLVLDMRLDVAFREAEQDDRRSLLASSAGIVDGAQGKSVPPSYERICQRKDEPHTCLSLLAGGLALGPTERRIFALYFALDTVWEGVEEAIRDMVNAAALRAMVTTMIGTALVMLVAPEPVTKLIAIALTASLIAYLGTGPVWNIGQGFLRLMEESRDAVRVDELASAGPWTPKFERIFRRAEMDLNDPENLVRVRGHQGPHPREYHEAILERLEFATQGCRGAARCRARLVEELARIARELVRQGSELRALVPQGARE
ncbi:AHH domain-containing protein [Myxococcus stipitatus]|uniref:AHH domain-containing protein n=1 Tax=Myxococcus stipitatus TaxID=83455 RepID=UPI001F20D497|nr:AHH domain-containing protein [Myxococcus stipitatus]MCE9671841.1 AHH domain-containing protein [Myxococcus stipitatus]